MSVNRIYNRNPFDQPAPRDSEILRRATSLKIDLYRDTDGDLHGEVKIGCGMGAFGPEGEDFDGQKQCEAMAFARRLLAEFEKTKPDDASAAG